MKTIYNCWIVLSVLLLATSCNDEWTEEQYKQYISFAAPINDQGVMNIYVRYKTDGKVDVYKRQDWHHTDSSKWVGFRARSVIGGYWMKVLRDKVQNNQ